MTKPVTPEATLRRLFLTLFLRGRSSRGLSKDSAPKSVATKLWLIIGLYALMGAMALAFLGQSLFSLTAALHGMTFVFLGMFVAASSGEILFNKDEGDILLHRPVTGRTLLRAKVRVLVEVSLWLGGAFNLVGLFVGAFHPHGSWLFPLAHALSMTLEALFCTGCVVLVYQLCLRWFGRERLDSLMTAAQVVMAVSFVLMGQVLPRFLRHLPQQLHLDAASWWTGLVPPLWFAAMDMALTGQGGASAWALAGLGVAATVLVLRIAFGKLSAEYERGLQTLNEVGATLPQGRARRRWFDRLASVPPLRWWLRDSVSRAAFLLTAAYLVRDRELKLRLYPSLASLMVLPAIFFFDGRRGGLTSGHEFAFIGVFLAVVPMTAIDVLRCSNQWQAGDVFRVAPLLGPAQLCHGTRRAVLFVLTVPLLLVFAGLALATHASASNLLLVLPGVIALPLYALAPSVLGRAAPLSQATEQAKAVGRNLSLLGVMLIAMVMGGIAIWAQLTGWFWWLMLGETVVVVALYVLGRLSLATVRWSSAE